MKSKFWFGYPDTDKEVRQLENFLLAYPMDYPNYAVWVRKVCIPEIMLGWKTAFIGLFRDVNEWRIIGDIIYQPGKESDIATAMHIKNLRVEEGFRVEGVASFLLRQAHKSAIATGKRFVIGDLRENKRDVLSFMLQHKYKVLYNRELYDNKLDTVVVRELKK